MRMGIDESRQHRGAVQVVDGGVLARRGARSGLVADESDAIALGDDGLDGFGRVTVHRDDRAAAVESRVLCGGGRCRRSEELTSELPSLMRFSSAVFGLKKKKFIHKLPI